MKDFDMPMRRNDDGEVSVERIDDGAGNESIAISCSSGGLRRGFVCSPYNAVRILASLAMVLGVRLAKAAERAIRL
jgi:hypothetical protein